MLFWFKNKEIVLDCFTIDPFAYNYCKIDRAVNFYPEWWKNLDTVSDNIPTMKHCRGFTRLYTNSIIMPCWEDILVRVSKDKFEWRVARNKLELGSHGSNQYQGFVNTAEYQNLKIPSVWYFKTNRFVEFMMSDPIWNRSDVSSYSILPGIQDFKYQPDTAVNILFKYGERPRDIEFNVGDPLACFTPLTEHNVKIVTHLVEPRELTGLVPSLGVGNSWDWSKKYQARKKFINKMDSKQGKCPFGLGNKS